MNFVHFGAAVAMDFHNVNKRGVKSEALWPAVGSRFSGKRRRPQRLPEKRGQPHSWGLGFRFSVFGFRFQVSKFRF